MKQKLPVLIFIGSAAFVGYVLRNPLPFHLCQNIYYFNDQIGCIDRSIEHVGSPLFIFALLVFVSAVIAAQFSSQIFKSWLIFAIWGIPFSIIYIWSVHVTTSAWIDFFPFYRDDAARLAGGLFTLISLALIAWKYRSFSV